MPRIKSDSSRLAKLERSQRRLRSKVKKLRRNDAAHEKRVADLIDSHKKDTASLIQCHQKVQADSAARWEKHIDDNNARFFRLLDYDAVADKICDLQCKSEEHERAIDDARSSMEGRVDELAREVREVQAQLGAQSDAAPQVGAAVDEGTATTTTTLSSQAGGEEVRLAALSLDKEARIRLASALFRS